MLAKEYQICNSSPMLSKSILNRLFMAAAAAQMIISCNAALELYVAPSQLGGSDQNPGTRQAPMASIQTARDFLRQIQKDTQFPPEGGASINLLPGDYLLTETLDFSHLDNGRRDSRIIIRSADPEKPARLIGGHIITNFTLLTNQEILNRLPEGVRGKIYTADLKALGMTNFGKLNSRGFACPTWPAHCELFYNGEPMTLAQWPNKGEFTSIAGFPEGGVDDEHGSQIGAKENGYFYEGDRPSLWKTPSAANPIWAHGYWAWDWANSYQKITSIDTAKKLILLEPKNLHGGFRKGQRVYYVNILEELDQPGEYYVDTEQGILFFLPPEEGAPRAETFVSELETPMISMKQASFITFENIDFTATRGQGVVIENAINTIIKNCRFTNIGSRALELTGGSGCLISKCDFINTGDGGVSVSGGDRMKLTPCGHIVQDCIFRKQGRWSRCYVPAINLSGVGIRVRHNLISDHPHAAILFSGNDHLIEFNEIHHIALETGDVGAIYAGRDYTFRGNKIQYNYIHHTGGVNMGSMGLYNDDSLSGTYMYGNLFYKVQRAVFMGGGRDFVVKNNVFVDCTPSISLDGRGLDKKPVWYNQVYKTLKERLEAVPRGVYERRYPEIYTVEKYLAKPDGVPPENIIVQQNISVGGRWKDVYWHATDDMVTWLDNFVDQDPGFVDPENGNFNLKPDSPALKFGFKPLPLDQIGPRR